MQQVRSTTILAVRHRGQVAVAGDGQVTLGNTIVKHQAKKVRRLYKDRVITGFAGATADAFTLYDRLEQKLEQFNGSLLRAATELARDWRTDKMLRRLEAMLIAVDAKPHHPDRLPAAALQPAPFWPFPPGPWPCPGPHSCPCT